MAYSVVPYGLDLAGIDSDNLSTVAQALLHLIMDAAQLAMTVLILWIRLKAYRPREKGWFSINLRPVLRWLIPVVAATVLFPVFDQLARESQVVLS